MPESIHGHEVMQMMVDAKQSFTKESLEEAIIAKFGAETVFYTCSAQNMSAKELIAFLESKGKFIPSKEGFKTDQDKICNH